MSIEQLKDLFGNQDAILELVQLEGGALALRNAGSENEPLVTIQFNEEVKALLGDQTPMIAQQMIQAALFGLLEKQSNEWHAEVVDERLLSCFDTLFIQPTTAVTSSLDTNYSAGNGNSLLVNHTKPKRGAGL